jgi:hypothetical protein
MDPDWTQILGSLDELSLSRLGGRTCHKRYSQKPFKGDRRLSLKTARDLEDTCCSGAGTCDPLDIHRRKS